jgi:hypothetical protein
MKRAIVGVSAAVGIALAPLGIALAQGHSGDPCASITDPAAHQACINNSASSGYARDGCAREALITDRWAKFAGNRGWTAYGLSDWG